MRCAPAGTHEHFVGRRKRLRTAEPYDYSYIDNLLRCQARKPPRQNSWVESEPVRPPKPRFSRDCPAPGGPAQARVLGADLPHRSQAPRDPARCRWISYSRGIRVPLHRTLQPCLTKSTHRYCARPLRENVQTPDAAIMPFRSVLKPVRACSYDRKRHDFPLPRRVHRTAGARLGLTRSVLPIVSVDVEFAAHSRSGRRSAVVGREAAEARTKYACAHGSCAGGLRIKAAGRTRGGGSPTGVIRHYVSSQ